MADNKDAEAKKKPLQARFKEERLPEAVWPDEFGEKKKK